MKALVVGNGGREHAIAWKLSRSNRISGLYVAPGNAGTGPLCENLAIDPQDTESLVRASVERKVDLVFVGPEAPLAAGLVDSLEAAGVGVIGPPAKAAQLEASKAESKRFMEAYRIPTAAHRTFTDTEMLATYIRGTSRPLVVKKSGLAAGKGVIESDDPETLVSAGQRFVREGDAVVVEDRLTGYEVSVFGLSDGSDYVLLPVCTDYKKAGAGSTGPNTGGMGAICPVPWLTPETMDTIREIIVEPTYAGLRDAGLMYRGILYFGVMVTDDGPMLLEYNVRFGDPETQVVLPLIQNDFGNLCDALLQGAIASFPVRFSPDTAVGVVIAAPGYPSEYTRGLVVDRLPNPPENEGIVFHSATVLDEDGSILTNGGRCFTVVGLGPELLTARSRAYAHAKDLTFEGSWFRPDIGGRIFG